MGCLLTAITFIFLSLSIIAELVSLLTSYMVINRFAPGLHDGIFQRCGAINYFHTAINSVGSFVTNMSGSFFKPSSGCFWWSSALWDRDEKSMQATVVLAFVSLAVVALTIIFFFISLIDRFRNRSLYIFLGVLVIINGLLLIGIILLYTFLYAKEARVTRKYFFFFIFFSFMFKINLIVY